MSKNVAVFVDVANIFYAAKAAGVDIDYTTLLKTATAGRDFVRAYAYTGLDPDNDNQRQFHSFLARSGYKVVSKDIRKYGDGKVKANLDIELVVDMMRTAQNLDIAVVVSGDGDFAPAIRAVQQMGVRVEVISFRGNTSSDLIEVADTFIDITQIAKVEKGSSRSGRRVAAEDDLSMTEVPDKESEGAPRRGRGGRGRGRSAEREETPAAAAAVEAPTRGRRTTATGADLVVLPGEKLSKVAAAAVTDEDVELDDAGLEAEPVERVAADDGVDATEAGARPDAEGEVDAEGHRRRRRRRGGRGRGRGRGQDREAPTEAGAPGVATPAGSTDDDDEEDEDLDAYPAPRAPQASAFGSVWDSQIGVPSAPLASADLGGPTAEDEDEDEPEIPEYLLAERRQRAGRPGGRPAQPGRGRGGRPGGRGGAYQSAVDRERYGRSGGSAFGGNGGNSGGAPRSDRGPRPDRGPRYGSGTPRPDRGPRTDRPPTRTSSAPSTGDPWSEVPPELEEMLRAELARKGTAPRGGSPTEATAGADARPKTRASTRRPAAAAAAAASVTDVASTSEAEAKPKRRPPTRKVAGTEAATSASVVEGGAGAKAKPKRRAPARKTAATEATAASAIDATASVDAGVKPKRRTSTRKAPTEA
ncbi:MAG TPA: NYN domain-containing protein [Candidatus Limnocylindrales bacterium]